MTNIELELKVRKLERALQTLIDGLKQHARPIEMDAIIAAGEILK